MKHETKINIPNVSWVITYVLLVSPLSGVCTDIFVPSLPNIQHYFNVNTSLTQLSVSLFLLGYGLTQIPFGVLSDRYGRRKLLILGALGFVVSTFLVTRATSIYFLLSMRLLEGVSIACFVGVARALIPDVFIGKTYHKITTYGIIVWGMGPIIAPFIGGYLQHYFGWHAPFYFLMGYGLIVLLVSVFFVPETNLNLHKADISTLMARTKTVLQHPAFIAGVILCGLIFSMQISFNIMAPFLIQKVLAKSAIYYGHIALFLGAAWFIGTIISRFLLDLPLFAKVRTGIMLIFLVCLISIAIVLFNPISVWTIVIPTFIMYILCGIIYPTIYGRTLQLFPDFSGLSSSLCGSLLIITTAIVSSLASLLHTKSQLPMATLWLLISCVLLLVYFALFSKSITSNRL